MKLLWEEFMVEVDCPGYPGIKTSLCGLCGNTGKIDTVGKIQSPAGVSCGIRAFCICPNGRAWKKHDDKNKPPEPKLAKSKRGTYRYWAGWNEYSEDYRPAADPPNKAILGWWCSGYAGDSSYSTMCAWVEAKDEAAAMKAVTKDWPVPKGQEREWRFFEEREYDWDPGDRFPLEDWSKKRVKQREG